MPVAGCEHWMCTTLVEGGGKFDDKCPFETMSGHQAQQGGLNPGDWTNFEATTMRQAQGHEPDEPAKPCLRYTTSPVSFHARIHALRPPAPEKEPA